MTDFWPDLSYIMPLAVRIWGRLRGEHDIDSAYSLGKSGMLFNMVGLLYLVFAVVTFNLPSVAPVSADNMNYTSAAVGVSVVIATLTWFTTGRKSYTGPQRGGILGARNGQEYGPRAVQETTVFGKAA